MYINYIFDFYFLYLQDFYFRSKIRHIILLFYKMYSLFLIQSKFKFLISLIIFYFKK